MCGDAICGGIISQSKFNENIAANMMCTFLPDEKYDEYIKLIRKFKDKEANAIVDEFGMQAI